MSSWRTSIPLRRESGIPRRIAGPPRAFPRPSLLAGLELEGKPVLTAMRKTGLGFRDRGVRLRDVDGDGRCELIVANESQNAVFAWSDDQQSWKRLPYSLPANAAIVDAQGRDN